MIELGVDTLPNSKSTNSIISYNFWVFEEQREDYLFQKRKVGS